MSTNLARSGSEREQVPIPMLRRRLRAAMSLPAHGYTNQSPHSSGVPARLFDLPGAMAGDPRPTGKRPPTDLFFEHRSPRRDVGQGHAPTRKRPCADLRGGVRVGHRSHCAQDLSLSHFTNGSDVSGWAYSSWMLCPHAAVPPSLPAPPGERPPARSLSTHRFPQPRWPAANYHHPENVTPPIASPTVSARREFFRDGWACHDALGRG